MAQVPQKTLHWLWDVLRREYRDAQRAYNDLGQVLATYPGFTPRTDVYTSESGAPALLVNLNGTLPVSFRGSTYRFPIAIWTPHNYPYEPPVLFVTPTNDMSIRPGQHVSASDGKIYHPYLANWRSTPDRCTIAEFLTILIDIFTREPPVMAKQPQPSRPPPGSTQNAPPPRPPLPGQQQQPPPSPRGPALPPSLPPKQSDSSRSSSVQPPEPQRPGRYDAPPPLPQSQPPPQSYSAHAPAATVVPRPQYGQPGPGPPQQLPRPQSWAQPHPGQQMTSPPPQFQQPPYQQSTQRQPQPPNAIQSTYQQSPSQPQPQQQQPHQPSALPPQQSRYPPQPFPQPPPQQQPQPPKPQPAPDLLDDSPFDLTLNHPQSTLPTPAIPPNPEKAALLSTLSSTLSSHLSQQLTQSTSALPLLSSQHNSLQTAHSTLTSELNQLQSLQTQLTANITALNTALTSADRTIASARQQAKEGKVPTIDEMIIPPTVVARQLYETVAEQRGYEAAMWALTEGFVRGRIGSEVWGRKSRECAREEFRRKWLVRRIGRGMGLDVSEA